MMKTRYGHKVYPLTAAQRLHFFCLQYCPKKEVLNIGSSLTIEIELDWNLLKDAINQAYERCESMRLRLASDKDGNVYQYVADHEDREIEHFDFTGWREEDARQKMEEWTKTPFQRFDTPLNRVVMIKTPDGCEGLYVLVDHMTMDAQSLILFLKDIIEIYSFMRYPDTEGLQYPKEMSSYIKQLEKDLEYEAGNSSSLRDREFFETLISSSEPIFADIYGPGKLETERKKCQSAKVRAVTNTSDNVDANIVNFHLEKEPTMQLMKFCEDNQISMVCLFLMGLRTFLQKENDLDDISLTTTIARRATLLEKRCGGSRIHCFPFRTIVPREDTFMEGILKIRDGQNQLFRHANFDPVQYYDIRQKHYNLQPGQTYETMSLTYQPMTLQEKGLDKLQGIRYKTARYTNGVAAHTLYLTISHRAEDNGLEFGFEHQTGVVTPDRLEYLYYYLCKILFKGITHPDRTVGEIIASV